jgi:hypothetical protein
LEGTQVNTDATCIALVDQAEELFTSRWRLGSLRSIDPELHKRLREQCALFEAALFGPDDRETRLQAEATVRGWKAALQRMEEIDAADDAFLYGTDPETGLVVAIGDRPPSESRLRLMDGHRVMFLTPAEVAKLAAGINAVAQIKQAFPDAEVLDLRPWPEKRSGAAPDFAPLSAAGVA